MIDIATIFAEFDGKTYNRDAIEKRFREISPRASQIARDPSKFRDEISAYPAYLGLYSIQLKNRRWVFKLSETAKQFLIVEEPNVSAFLLLQLLLFQYPNGMGAVYYNNGKAHIQANTVGRTLEFIRKGIHISPFRLICKALKADSVLNGIDSLHPRITVDEVFALTNDERVNRVVSPSLYDVVTVLSEFRNGLLSPIQKIENRFHILNHTDFLQVNGEYIHLRATVSQEDSDRLISMLDLINTIENQFDGFDAAQNKSELAEILKQGTWGNYFDGVRRLTTETVQSLALENNLENSATLFPDIQESDDLIPDNSALKLKYPLKERGSFFVIDSTPNHSSILADPEVTRIKRQRSNLQHKILVQKLDEYLRRRGAVPKESEHIDLFATIPNDGSFLFEVKSISSNNLLSQTRKGISQLYEYRYRYSDDIGEDVTLCLVYPYEPSEISWLQGYLCIDRKIAVCWFNQDSLCFPTFCSQQLQNLLIDGID